MIYADCAATTKLDKTAFEAMQPYFFSEYGNASQPYSFSRKPKKALAEARASIAECINAQPEEIFFTSGGTESDNWAIKGTMSYGDTRATITSQIEHHAILNSCSTLERLGSPVAYLSPNEKGLISPKTLEQSITNQTKLVSIMLANNEIGTIQPVCELSKISHAHGALFHTDAVQAVGHIPVDVQSLGVDMLSASGHKFNAPKGIGFLYIKKGTILSPYASGGLQEFGMRAGTENIASIVGMAVALHSNCMEIEKHIQHIQSLEQQLLQSLISADIPFLRNGVSHLPGNLSLSFKGQDGEALLHRLDLMGICVSTGSACDTQNTQISHVLTAINLPENYAKGTIRISFGKENTVEDVSFIASALVKIMHK